MNLRKFGVLLNHPGLRPRRLRLPAVLVGTAALLLTTFAGGSGAGISDYQGTLSMNGTPSAVAGSFQLLPTAGPAAPAQPTVSAGGAGSGSIPGGASVSYQYIQVAANGNAQTASVQSAAVAMVANGSATITNAQVGADLYRQRVVSGLPVNNYYLVKASMPTSPYTDTTADPSPLSSAKALPQADARVQSAASCATLNACGYVDFAPGVGYASSIPVGPVNPAPLIPSTCKGWTVDGAGGLSFGAGPWTYQVRVRTNAGANGTAFLTVGMWKVDSAGAPVPGGTLVDPTQASSDGSQNLIVAATTQTITYTTPANVPTFTLASSEHLCVQFWRHQTAASSMGASQRTLSLLAYDALNAITVHPAPNTLPAVALFSPAGGLYTASIPNLSATYSDAEADAGNVTIRLCTDSGCSSPTQNSGALPVTNGSTAAWTPGGPLADGTYYWQADAQDAGGASGWSASRSFILDTAAPATTLDSTPSAQSNLASGTFAFSSNESVTGWQCRIDGAAFAGCSSPHGYGPLADGPHTFDVKAVADLAGNPGTTTSYGWTIDTAPPDTTITSNPSSLSNSSNPSFGFTSTESGSFECSLDGAAFALCTDPKSYSGVADGAHTFQVRALDPAGNPDPSPASYGWTIDATPPDTTIGPSQPAPLTTATGATFDFSSSEAPTTFQCSLDGAVFSSCTSPKTYSALSDGDHTFQVRATDLATNVDPSPATYPWTVDTTPPATSIGPTMPPANTSSSSATFDLSSNEAGSTFECRLDGGLYGACTTPASYSGLGDGVHTFDLRATDPAGNLDTSPASYTWTIDNVAPSSPTLVAPADALMTNALPQLQATFDDATAGGDSGTVEFQLCSSSAPAGSACAPIVQSVTSGSVSSGATASATPAALADGTYHWQARAEDAAGNQSGWSATRSFQLDTTVPSLTLGEPADGAWVNTVHFTATFSKPSFAGTGSVEFRICSDALCLGVLKSAHTGNVLNGGLADWTPSSLTDGLYYWQARAYDSAGNVSAWSATRTFTRDTVSPGKPLNFNGQVAGDGLTLRWQAPGGSVANYVVFVNGEPWKNLGSSEYEVKMGPFDAGDTRTFSVVAVDPAGNIGTMSPVLVGVPAVTGATVEDARKATSTRGLVLKHSAMILSPAQMMVTSQDPAAPALVERGGFVTVTLEPAKGAPLAVRVMPARVICARTCILRLRVQLSAPALLRKRLLNAHGRVLTRGVVGKLRAGTSTVRVKLPRNLRRGGYRLVLDASGSGGNARALVRVKVGARKPA
jgi:hypothetical protein